MFDHADKAHKAGKKNLISKCHLDNVQFLVYKFSLRESRQLTSHIVEVNFYNDFFYHKNQLDIHC